MDAFFDNYMGIVQAIPQIITELINQLPTIITTIVNGLLEGIPDLIKAGADLLGGLITGLLDPATIWNAVKSLGNSILDGIKGFFGIASPSKVFRDQIGKNLALGIGEGFSDEMDTIEKTMQKSMAKLTPALEIESPTIAADIKGNNLLDQLIELVGQQKATEVINNYTIENKFEKMQTSRLALHQANLQMRRIVEG